MRLSSIKLSGFKSFAEPTTFVLPGQRVGVVGPNGCGKSNIMDAVRWVLGESRASELRGESMQDVIFNGTTTRKPAGRASVELVFDNADHRAGGPWARFAEIAVRRVLTRDGTSSYHLNNQPVRRRDVQDVFLGTGLGPRAYAIIGQGTISRIIESKPEELRLFLEEAAGVSKYKERRRETESRLADARENLTRVDDILRELNAQLEKLERQAEVAARYHALQDGATRRQHQLWFLKRAESAAGQDRAAAEAVQARGALDARTAELRHIEATLEGVRQAHYAAGDEVGRAQGRLYEASAEVGRLESEIRFVREGRQRVGQRLAQLREQAAQWSARHAGAEAELEALDVQERQAAEQGEALATQLAEHESRLPELETLQRLAQHEAGAQRTAVTQLQQHIQVLAAERRHIDEQSRQLAQRAGRLRTERDALAPPDAARLDELQARHAAAQASAAEAEARLRALQEQAPRLEQERRACQQAANAEAARHAELSARLKALEALQERLRTDGRLAPWLAKRGLGGAQGLWTRLRIEPGWERALEAALRERLGALELDRLDAAGSFGVDAPPARLAVYHSPDGPAPQQQEMTSPPPQPAAPPRLLELLQLHDAGLQALLAGWLHGCLTAASLDDALALRPQLRPGELVYVPQGHAVGAHSVSFYAQDSEQAGLLARAREIKDLQRQVRAQALIDGEAQAALARAEAACADVAQRLAAVRRDAGGLQAQAHAAQVEALRVAQRAEQAQARRGQLDRDLDEIQAQSEQLHERRAEAEARFGRLERQVAEGRERLDRLEAHAGGAARTLGAAREQHRVLERQAQEAAFARRTLAARRAELDRALSSAAQQALALSEEAERTQAELAQLSDAAAQAGLQQALAARQERENALGALRSRHDDLAQRLRVGDERRLALERELDPLRQRITELQLDEQAARLGVEQYQALLADAQADLAAVARSIDEDGTRLNGLQGEIDRLQREIAALGAVNLAALDELAAARERRGFLDAQAADLNEAIATLEDAIRTIDGETRELLGGTFASVNEHFGRMFPELFGGGTARLVMTGDEILDAGVQVMAQPPGKKNQTIHLLSGGEKALTAIALVFAIFQLNPAPFCLLDEVDAPLDDANTERYAKLVTRMSAGTQFLFISHNKIAMEMAGQLIGVTMQEQGVSRIVAVDMELAATLAQAA